MKKSELKVGTLVRLRNGEMRRVKFNKDSNIMELTKRNKQSIDLINYNAFGEYNENATISDFDIIEIVSTLYTVVNVYFNGVIKKSDYTEKSVKEAFYEHRDYLQSVNKGVIKIDTIRTSDSECSCYMVVILDGVYHCTCYIENN